MHMPRPGTYDAAVTVLPAPRPEWARPHHVLGAPVSITLLLARSATAAVRVQHVTAFPLIQEAAGRAVELWPEED
jgi:hypothetical protein